MGTPACTGRGASTCIKGVRPLRLAEEAATGVKRSRAGEVCAGKGGEDGGRMVIDGNTVTPKEEAVMVVVLVVVKDAEGRTVDAVNVAVDDTAGCVLLFSASSFERIAMTCVKLRILSTDDDDDDDERAVTASAVSTSVSASLSSTCKGDKAVLQVRRATIPLQENRQADEGVATGGAVRGYTVEINTGEEEEDDTDDKAGEADEARGRLSVSTTINPRNFANTDTAARSPLFLAHSSRILTTTLLSLLIP